jgi:hypothetical protein
MQPVVSTVALVNLYQIPEGSNPIHRQKYVISHKIFYVFRQSPVFVREIYSKAYLNSLGVYHELRRECHMWRKRPPVRP